jgi:hypothetical protein
MFKSISLIVVILATIAFAKEDSSGKKKEDVGTVIGIDLGVSFSLIENFSFFLFNFF